MGNKEDLSAIFSHRIRIPRRERESRCWKWLGRIDRGNPVVCIGRKKRSARRVAWEMERGPLPTDDRIYRTCSEKNCVNPWHASLTPPAKDPIEIFHESFVMPVDLEACWIWHGKLSKNGTPEFFAEGRAHSARIFSVRHEQGRDSEKVSGWYVPICGTHLCVNPEHLSQDTPLSQRFWALVDKGGPGGCWLWKGTFRTTRHGKIGDGCFQIRGKTSRSFHAHRIAWILSGRKIAKGKSLYTRCGNALCVNPDHREEGDVRPPAAPDRVCGDHHHASKLTEAQLPQVLKMAADGLSNIEIGKFFGVSNTAIGKILKGKTWKKSLAKIRDLDSRPDGP